MILALILACSGPRPAADLPTTDTPPAASEAPAAPPVGGPGTVGTPVSGGAPIDGTADGGEVLLGAPPVPAQAYAACRDRLELPEVAGECTTDADCSKAGCSQEVCVAAATAPDVMTTCEILPCFAALDTCGCQEGMCSWTLKSEMPPRGRLDLPPKPQ